MNTVYTVFPTLMGDIKIKNNNTGDLMKIGRLPIDDRKLRSVSKKLQTQIDKLKLNDLTLGQASLIAQGLLYNIQKENSNV